MNAAQIHNNLKMMDDNQLSMVARDSSAPQYLVLAELQRRKEMRGSGDMNKQSLAEELTAPQRFANGGEVLSPYQRGQQQACYKNPATGRMDCPRGSKLLGQDARHAKNPPKMPASDLKSKGLSALKFANGGQVPVMGMTMDEYLRLQVQQKQAERVRADMAAGKYAMPGDQRQRLPEDADTTAIVVRNKLRNQELTGTTPTLRELSYPSQDMKFLDNMRPVNTLDYDKDFYDQRAAAARAREQYGLMEQPTNATTDVRIPVGGAPEYPGDNAPTAELAKYFDDLSAYNRTHPGNRIGLGGASSPKSSQPNKLPVDKRASAGGSSSVKTKVSGPASGNGKGIAATKPGTSGGRDRLGEWLMDAGLGMAASDDPRMLQNMGKGGLYALQQLRARDAAEQAAAAKAEQADKDRASAERVARTRAQSASGSNTQAYKLLETARKASQALDVARQRARDIVMKSQEYLMASVNNPQQATILLRQRVESDPAVMQARTNAEQLYNVAAAYWPGLQPWSAATPAVPQDKLVLGVTVED